MPHEENMIGDRPKTTLRGLLQGLREDATRRRRLLAWTVAVLAALTVLVIVPGYVSSRPSFVRRYASSDEAYRTWSTSVHAKAPCRSCHVGPGLVSQAAFSARMLGEFYLSIVMPGREPDLFSKPSDASCSSCHMDLRTVSPSGDLNIPHRAHVNVLKMACVDCHGYLVHSKSPEGKNVPRMADCMKCHDGRKAKEECSACHTEKSEPLTHRAADWLVIHPAKASAGECDRCHDWTERWCADCHERRPRSHGKDWRSTHRDRVAAHRNCEACHEGPFCIRCHGEVPRLNFDPSLKTVR